MSERNFARAFRIETGRTPAAFIEDLRVEATRRLDHAVDPIFGPFWYRLLIGHTPLDPAAAAEHVTRLLHGLQPDWSAAETSDYLTLRNIAFTFV